MKPLHPAYFKDGKLYLIDQLLLPGEERHLAYDDPAEIARAIRDMVVRGAPAIGVAAGFGMAFAARRAAELPASERAAAIENAARTLRAARPTAVNLAWAIERMQRAIAAHLDSPGLAEAALREAQAIFDEDYEACRTMGRLGGELIPDGATVLTHCNAGALATAGYGTALGVVRGAVEAGKKIRVLADETRPYLQGARLTAWELWRDGIAVTLITDNMAGWLMQRGEITCAVIGSDRIASNGDVANKIGTYTVAVLCREHGIPFYVAAPLSTIDRRIASGEEIPIEERSSDEVTVIAGKRMAPEAVHARHPAFDVTPARLVSAIITERGIARAPYEESIARLFER
ncbi:MAG TPA: S-methyl-5-thioribose-1-phosphate isomerase [Myxococcales bacterium]|jgi:methylthioribose-1-phosphate isomerase|nr:S-methyl-5-thioribose-1-phosphate isomerase [Myxococcales bacterium]